MAWLGDAAAGNPALVRAVAGGARTRADVVEGLRAAQRTAPAELVHVVRWRLNQLPVRAREVAVAAGALGATFELDDLAATGAPPAMLRGPSTRSSGPGSSGPGPRPPDTASRTSWWSGPSRTATWDQPAAPRLLAPGADLVGWAPTSGG